MANTKASELPSAAALSGDEFMAGVQGGLDRKITARQIADISSAAPAPRPPWVKRVASEWKNVSVSSAGVTASSLRANPFLTQGLEVTAIDYHIQGSVAAGAQIFLGVYASDPATGLPTDRLWESGAIDLSGSGARTQTVTGVPVSARRVWVATYITGSAQFVTGAPSGEAERVFGVPTSLALNSPIQALVSSATWSGSMPSPFPYADGGLTAGGNVPLTFLRLAVPS